MGGNKQVIRSLARSVGKVSNFFDEHSVWKCFISNAYRYENEKCDIYNNFLKEFINMNAHFCPIKSKKKNLRNELIKYMRKNLKNDEDFYNIGFTAMRHLGRIKNSILQSNYQTKNCINKIDINTTKKNSNSEELGENNNVRYTIYSDSKLENNYSDNINSLMSRKKIWSCEEEKNMFKNNIHIIDIKKLNENGIENYDNNNIKIYGKKKKKKKYIKNDDIFLRKSKRLTQVLKNNLNKTSTATNPDGEVEKNSQPDEKLDTESSQVKMDDQPESMSDSPILKSENGQHEIKKGTILISHPLTSNTLWNKSVIIITHKDKNNIVYGLILNKHPLYNNYMCLSKEKEVKKILNNLYSKKKKKKNELHLQDDQKGISTSDNKISENTQENAQPCIEKGQASLDEVVNSNKEENKIETNEMHNDVSKQSENTTLADKPNLSESNELVSTSKTSNDAIVPNFSENKENSNNGKYDDFPTLKDLQEMFLRIQFRSTSKQFMNKKNIKNNNFFTMMDEHLLDIITHYIIKLNKVPLYLRFLPSYNIGSMTDIKCEIKKLEFLNEFYKIYFEKYNKWKVVIINNRIHIFDKEKKNKNKFKNTQNKLSLRSSNTIRAKATEETDDTKLTEEEKEKIHKKILKFKETNELINDDDQLEEDKLYDAEKKNKKQLLRTRAKQQMCEEEEEEEEEEDEEEDEEDEDEEDEEDDEEEEDDDEEDEDEEELPTEQNYYDNDSTIDIDKQTFEKLKNEMNTKRKEKNKVSSSIERIKSKSVSKNYYAGNPVNLFWLGGPLPGLTILHNIKKFSKNIIVNDVLYEGYNDNVNFSSLHGHNIIGKTDYELSADKIQADTNDTKLNEQFKTDNEENVNTDCGTNKKLIKRFIGKATWDLNQLIEELNNDYWIPINCDNKELLSKIIFNTTSEGTNNNEHEQMASSDMLNTYQGENLWEKILSSLNSDYENISKIPQYVIDNVLKDFSHAENE